MSHSSRDETCSWFGLVGKQKELQRNEMCSVDYIYFIASRLGGDWRDRVSTGPMSKIKNRYYIYIYMTML